MYRCGKGGKGDRASVFPLDATVLGHPCIHQSRSSLISLFKLFKGFN